MSDKMVHARNLVGLPVITSDATTIGKVDGTELDADSWKVTHIRVDITDDSARLLNLKKPFMGGIRISLPVSRILKVGDVVNLNSTLSVIKESDELKME